MKVQLISFQERAVATLHDCAAESVAAYRATRKTQVMSLQAPTGAGKTIMAAALIERVFRGSCLSPHGDFHEEMPDAVFVWLSDSPELNAQSRDKLERLADGIGIGRCETIEDESFDRETLEDGKVYFINTQKLAKTSNLCKPSDARQYTIWETLENTIAEKGDRLFFVIDEAHRGARSTEEKGRDTTIMQRFLKGYEYTVDGRNLRMRAMPMVLGISATAARFEKLVDGMGSLISRKCVVSANEVRDSGLLKEKIVVTYPSDGAQGNEEVLLAAAVDEWRAKCVHWAQYTREQHLANVDPVLVVQVQSASAGEVTRTNLGAVIATIERTTGVRFAEGEVVHAFGEGVQLEVNGLAVPHVKASEIAGDHRIKVVLFKEALSTGWDCPRAETMMSYAVRTDPTYIAQLLGRMVRTPLGMHVRRDEFLNDVKLFLPHFDREAVEGVVKALQEGEGGEIPTEIDGRSLEEGKMVVWSANTPIWRGPARPRGRDSGTGPFLPGFPDPGDPMPTPTPVTPIDPANPIDATSPTAPTNPSEPTDTTVIEPPVEPLSPSEQQIRQIDRSAVREFVNSNAFLNYSVRSTGVNNWLKSLFLYVTLLTQSGVDRKASDEVKDAICARIADYVSALKRSPEAYEKKINDVLQLKFSQQVFDLFGNKLRSASEYLPLTETDVERLGRRAEQLLGGFGILWHYMPGVANDGSGAVSEAFAHVILFADDAESMESLKKWAKSEFERLSDKHRMKIANHESEDVRRRHREIVSDSDAVAKIALALPDVLCAFEGGGDGEEYGNHLYVNEERGTAHIKLNAWERDLIREESRRDDFVCWVRNVPRARWALCLPYVVNGETKAFYPDFLVIRRDAEGKYMLDILEPHGQQFSDGLAKAKALAKYAREEQRCGRIQMIRKVLDPVRGEVFKRLDMTKTVTQSKVLSAQSVDELDHLFAIGLQPGGSVEFL